VARFFDGEFGDELKVANKSVVDYHLGRKKCGVPLLSLPIKIAEFDLHLIDIRHSSIGRYERPVCPGGRLRKKQQHNRNAPRSK
jgi:hypothetical protein